MPGCLLDANVLLAATFSSHEFHRAATGVLLAAAPSEPAILCRATEQSFLRLATTERILRHYGAEGLTNRDALLALATLLARPDVEEREEPPGTVSLWHQLAARETASPKVWMDAYLAAFAICGSFTLVTLDRDLKAYVSRGLRLRLLGAS